MAEPIESFVLPSCSGTAFVLNRGQRLRVIEHEGKQVASLMFFNAHDHREQFMAEFSGGLNYAHPDRPGTHYRVGKLYSKVPFENVMLTMTHNEIGDHFLGTHCTSTMMEILGAPGHRTCTDNFSEALSQHGLSLEDVYSPSVLNAFANVRIDPRGDGTIRIEAPRSERGDYIELLAEMDVLVAVSACPDDVSAMNDYACKAIGLEIFESA